MRVAQLRRPAVLAFACTAIAYAFLVQNTGPSQGAHYALVKALAQGTPEIDETRHQVGELGTSDISYVDGHVYAGKAPGLALASVPAYVVAKALGVPAAGDPGKMLWVLTFWGVVLPALALLALLWWFAERLEPGTGAVTAITAGLGTLLLPYATVFYAHALSTALGFAALVVLVEALRRGRRLLLGAAGVAAGLATTVEYPLALVGAVLFVSLVFTPGRMRNCAAFAAGGVIGVAPLLAYNWWAFRALVTTPYTSTPVGPGDGVLGLGFYRPTFDAAVEILAGTVGLLRFGPVLACGLVGLWFLYGRGHRREALLGGAVFALYLVYNASYFAPIGGLSAGPRFMIPALPFASLGFAAAWQVFPEPTRVLALVSATIYAVVTATHPLEASTGGVLDRFTDGGFAWTLLDYFVRLGDLSIVLFFAAVALGLGGAFGASRVLMPQTSRAAVVAAALAAWASVALASPRLVAEHSVAADVALVGLVIVGIAGSVFVWRLRIDERLRAARAGA